MSEEEQLKRMRLEILKDSNNISLDDTFKIKLDDAEVIALNTLYPYDKTKTSIDENDKRLKNWQTRCAIILYNKADSTNVQSYSENGLTVSFMKGLLPDELINELISKAGAIK